MLNDLLQIISEYFIPDNVPAFSILQEISKNDQMNIIPMFMSNGDKTGM